MKRLLFLVTFLLSVQLLTAQKSPSKLNVYGSYVFQDRIEFDGFTGYVNEGFQYGGGLEYFVQPTTSLELRYLRQNTDFPLYTPNGSKLNEGKTRGSVNYVLLSGNGYMGTSSSKVVPFAGLGLGVGILDVKEGRNATKFAWDARLGIHVKTSGKISLKLQSSLQSIISTFGSEFYLSSAGTIIAVPDYASLLQFGLGGALCFSF